MLDISGILTGLAGVFVGFLGVLSLTSRKISKDVFEEYKESQDKQFEAVHRRFDSIDDNIKDLHKCVKEKK